MKKIIVVLSSLFVLNSSFAAVEYVVGRDGSPMDEDMAEAGRQKDLFYIYGGYNLHFANDLSYAKIEENRWNLFGGFGVQLTDNFRLELAYERMAEEYELGNEFMTFGRTDSTGHFGFLNFIFDARLIESHRMFKTSPFVPFVGFGIGLGGFGFDDNNLGLKKDISAAYNFIGGVDVEINRTIAVTLTYRYMKTMPNDLVYEVGGNGWSIPDFAPSSHNVGLAAKMKF